MVVRLTQKDRRTSNALNQEYTSLPEALGPLKHVQVRPQLPVGQTRVPVRGDGAADGVGKGDLSLTINDQSVGRVVVLAVLVEL